MKLVDDGYDFIIDLYQKINTTCSKDEFKKLPDDSDLKKNLFSLRQSLRRRVLVLDEIDSDSSLVSTLEVSKEELDKYRQEGLII